MDARTKVTISLLVLLAVVMVGAAGYHILGLDVLESIYMAVITLTTVGARDVDKLGRPGELWTIIFIAVFFTVAVYTFSNLLALVAGGELRKVLGRRHLQDKIKALRDHIIVCGYGGMGKLVCQDLLAHSVPVVVVDSSADKTTELEEAGVLYVLGDATEEQTLLTAGIEHARGLVATLPHDSDNVYATLTARSLRSSLKIVARAELASTENKLIRAGADRVVCSRKIGAARITNLLLRPAIVELVDVASRGVELEVGELTVEAGSPLANKPLRDSGLRESTGAMVVAIRRKDGTTIYSPPPQTVLLEGDSLITIGKSGGLKQENLEAASKPQE